MTDAVDGSDSACAGDPTAIASSPDTGAPSLSRRGWSVWRRVPWWARVAGAVLVVVLVIGGLGLGRVGSDPGGSGHPGPVSGPHGRFPDSLPESPPAHGARAVAQLPDQRTVVENYVDGQREVQAYHGLIIEAAQSVARYGDHVYVRAVNAHSGATYWTYHDRGHDLDVAQVDASTGRLYVVWADSTFPAQLTAAQVELRTGRVVWQATLDRLHQGDGGSTTGGDAVIPRSGQVIIRALNGFAVLATATGRRERTVVYPPSCHADGHDLAYTSAGLPVLAGDTLVVQTSCGPPVADTGRGHLRLSGYDLTTGAVQFGARVSHLFDLTRALEPNALHAEMFAVDAHTVVVRISGLDQAVVLDTASGRWSRRHDLPEVDATAGRLGIGDCRRDHRALCGYDLTSGTVRWRVRLPDKLEFDPWDEGMVVVAGHVYAMTATATRSPDVGYYPRHLVVVNPSSGRLDAQVPLGGPVRDLTGTHTPEAWLAELADGHGLALTHPDVPGSILTAR